jgi:hypothetical protein
VIVNKIIEIVVSPQGETRLETKGFVGAECREASRHLENALGIREAERLTADFHQAQTARHEARQSH